MLTIISGCSKTEIYCDDGFSLEDGQCVYEEKKLSQRKMVYYCMPDGTLKGNQCEYYYSFDATENILCPTNYREYLNKCKFKHSGITGNCRIGQVEWLGNCYEQFVYSYQTYYYCQIGTLKGDKCIQFYNQPALEKYEYYCEEGYTLIGNEICYKMTYKTPLKRKVSIFS